MNTLPALAGWENFYVILGSAAAGLTGLTFVVVALAADANMTHLSGLRTFVSPTVIHFSSALWITALCSVPRHTVLSLGVTGHTDRAERGRGTACAAFERELCRPIAHGALDVGLDDARSIGVAALDEQLHLRVARAEPPCEVLRDVDNAVDAAGEQQLLRRCQRAQQLRMKIR